MIKGNLCGDRVHLGRVMQKLAMRQEDLARRINRMGTEIASLIITTIEKNQRHVCDAELKLLAKALGVSTGWLYECGEIE